MSVIQKVGKVLISKDRNDFCLNILFCGTDDYLLLKDSNFTKCTKKDININLYEKLPFLLVHKPDIVEIKEHDELDSYYILMEDKSIFRIFFSQILEEVQQVIEHHRFDGNENSYYNKLNNWYKTSEVVSTIAAT